MEKLDINQKTFNFLMNHSIEKEYKKGEFCFRGKEKLSSIYIMVSGRAIIYNLTHNGQRKILYILGKGQILNESVVSKQPSSVFCEVITDSKILQIPANIFLEAMKNDFDFNLAVIKSHERRIWRLSHQLKNTTGSTQMEKKLAAKIWKLARDFGTQTDEGILIAFPITITFLADFLGTPRETASRLCKILSNEGLIRIQKNKQILVLDAEGLSDFYKKEKEK